VANASASEMRGGGGAPTALAKAGSQRCWGSGRCRRGYRCAVERGDGRCRRILDMHPIPHTLAFADHWNLSPANLVTDIAVGLEPGAGAVEEAIAKGDEVNARGSRRPFQLAMAATAGEAA